MSINVNSESAVLRSQDCYRLKLPLQSQGDIFEIDSSASVVYVGPDSDLSGYRVTYYDPNSPNEIAQAGVTVGGPLLCPVQALLDTQYSLLGQPARILVSTQEFFEPDYERNLGTGTNPLRTIIQPPIVDLVFSFSPLGAAPTRRPDRIYRYFKTPSDGTLASSTDLLVPAYGRRGVTIQAIHADPTTWTVQVYAVAFQQSSLDGAYLIGSFTVGGVSLGDPADVQIFQVNTSDLTIPTGQFDYLLLNLAPDLPPPRTLDALTIRLSDSEV